MKCLALSLTLAILSIFPLFSQEVIQARLDRENAELEAQVSILEQSGENSTQGKRAIVRIKEIEASQDLLFLEIYKNQYRSLKASGKPVTEESAIHMLMEWERILAERDKTIELARSKGLPTVDMMPARASGEAERKKWESRATFEAVFTMAHRRLFDEYPDAKDPDSVFSKQLSSMLDQAISKDDPIMENPRHLLVMARLVSKDMRSDAK